MCESLKLMYFADAWEQCKLGEISKMYQPQTITGAELLSEGIPVFGANGFIGFYSVANHSENQVTISARGEGTGTPSYVHGPVWITGNSMVVNVDASDIDKYFLFANLTANSLKKYVTGGAQPQLTRDVLIKVPIALPNGDEQAKIGSFFRILDNLITLHQRKLEKIKALKQAYLSEMFPAEGERKPKRRFPEFTDAWEQCKFEKLVSRVSLMGRGEPDLPCIEYEDIVSGQGQLNKDIYEKKSTKNGIRFEPGDVLFGKLRPYLKNWLLPDFTGIAVGDWWVLRPQDTNGEFIYTLIQSPKYQMVSNLSTGTKMPRSDWSVVSKTAFSVPSDMAEQIRIGAVFRDLDNLITLHQRKLEKLQNIKQAYLNEMFV